MQQKERIIIVDALRGFALFLIVIIHYVEHFDLFKLPEHHFLFGPELDKKVMDTTFLLISGKAYSVFALLFGLSFFIQMDRKAQLGVDFRSTFLRRIGILLFLGFIHSLIYKGDILHIYALLGIPLVLLYRVNSKILLAIAMLLALQIPMLYNLILSFVAPDFEYVKSIKSYFKEGNEVYAFGSLSDVISFNLWKGRITVWAWTYYNGRYLQLIALFIVGMVLGRRRIFEQIPLYRRSFIIVLTISVTASFVIYASNGFLQAGNLSDWQKKFSQTLLTSYGNLAITSSIVSLLILVYSRFKNAKVFKLLAAYGKMSLSNYIFQAILGVIVFYGFGFAMYRYMGAAWSMLLGCFVFLVQALISYKWSSRYYYGPLEWLWRCLTYWDFTTPFHRAKSDAG